MSTSSRLDKQTAVSKIHKLIGLQEEALGPGSKEHKKTFVAIAKFVGMDAPREASKQQLAASLCDWLGGEWNTNCYSAGDTVTLEGLTRILRLLEERKEKSSETEGVVMEETPTNVSSEPNPAEPDEETAEELAEERQAVEFNIAELIASLSRAEETPTEVDAPGYSFTAKEIDFTTTSWIASLCAVQGWLSLPSPLEMAEPDKFIEQLGDLLGIENPMDSVEAKSRPVKPSDSLLELLNARLERAVQNLEVFIEAREAEGSTMATATAAWSEAWEEEEADEVESSGPVSAQSRSWYIFNFSEDARRARIDLNPSYQRGDVWPTTDSQLLIESILRGIPLPSIIILRPNERVSSEGTSISPYEVVDGKQRLTAILRFIGRHPDALALVRKVDEDHAGENLLNLFETDYPKFRRKWKNLQGEPLTASKEKEYCFPFRLRKGKTSLSGILKQLEGKYFTQILEKDIQISDQLCTVEDVFRSSVYSIPVIEYNRATPRQIHEVFKLYNKQGKHLNAEEIRNAVFHELDLTRSLIVASGDNEDVSGVANCLVPIWNKLSGLGGLLEQYGAGVTRYKRTKLLSWLIASLVYDSINKDTGRLQIHSTAGQIDALLQRVLDKPNDPLRHEETIRDLFSLVAIGVNAHSSIDEAWAPIFKDLDSGAKWQELQLIGSLLGVVSGAALLGDGIQERLEEYAEDRRAATATSASKTSEWRRPKKTQTRSQWEFIAKTALNVMEILHVNPDEASEALQGKFGY